MSKVTLRRNIDFHMNKYLMALVFFATMSVA